MLQRPHTSTLFPYTTLFRSSTMCKTGIEVDRKTTHAYRLGRRHALRHQADRANIISRRTRASSDVLVCSRHIPRGPNTCGRSEENTSELQSRQYLVCRLLLE